MEVCTDYRCVCGKLLFKGAFMGTIDIKCSKCKVINHIFITLPSVTVSKNFRRIKINL